MLDKSAFILHYVHFSSLRDNILCVKCIVLVITRDCESGNKSARDMIRSKIQDGSMDPDLHYLTVLSDAPHLGKALKASLKNWWLRREKQRANLDQITILRNRSDDITKAAVCKMIPKNDHATNKDRQDPSSTITLSNDCLVLYLNDVGYVCKAIIPELDDYTTENVLGKYPYPHSVRVGSYGWILFLSYNIKEKTSKLFKARLHNPVDSITEIASGLSASDVQYSNGIIYVL